VRRDVEFTSAGETVRGWLYTPDTGDGPFPTVVLAGGWCYVKEIVQAQFAQAFADAGLAAVLIDISSAPHRPQYLRSEGHRPRPAT
jgi:uncharacterized protein